MTEDFEDDDEIVWTTVGEATELIEIDRPRLRSVSPAAHRALCLTRRPAQPCGFAIPARAGR